jgi:Trk-type K+ transport system membrane component
MARQHDRPQKLDYQAPPTESAVLHRRLDFTVLIWLFCGYLLVLPFAAMLLGAASSRDAGNELNLDRTRFAVINAATLTGLPTTRAPNIYTPAAQLIILSLILIGILFSLIVGGVAAVRILRLPYSDRQVVRAGFLTTAALVIIGSIPLIASGRWTVLQAFFLSASAFGNSGLYLGPNPPGSFDWATHLVLLPLAVVGGLGLPVLMELGDSLLRRRRAALSVHTRTVLHLGAWLYLLPLLLILFVQWLAQPKDASPAELVASSSIATLNSRTFGLPVQFASALARPAQWLVILLMVIGGASASAAGGLKVTTLAVLFRGVRRSLRGEAPGRPFGIAATWTALYFAAAVLCTLVLLWGVDEWPADQTLFHSISALSNVGLAHQNISIRADDPTSKLFVASLAVNLASLFGRLAPLAILWWMASTDEPSELAVG